MKKELLPNDNNYYMSADGTLKQATSPVVIDPLRWVMHIQPRSYDGNNILSANSVKSYDILTLGEDIRVETAIQLLKEKI